MEGRKGEREEEDKKVTKEKGRTPKRVTKIY